MDKPVKKVVLDVSGHFPDEGKKKKVVTEKIWNKQNSRKVSFLKSTSTISVHLYLFKSNRNLY